MSRLKKDSIIILLVTIVCFLFGLSFNFFFDWRNPWFIITFVPAFIGLYYSIVYKKRFRKVKVWKEQLNLSEEDLIRLSHASKYDIPKWEKGKVSLSWPKMCRLTDKLEEMIQQS
ncbi:hypothetical protein [Carnobacterium antarcticum]|uniref:Uncharacterized protein n=1 Tax=Carnobacterium antarcticum TaxID=2126436 RepID=A0ABW4NNG1_9LACT|nr:hypothetical protein [Carnobacterium sp. CP1]ALV22174.1 hypothetical protein NY10_1573 [Carnobacterium sp. CP1]